MPKFAPRTWIQTEAVEGQLARPDTPLCDGASVDTASVFVPTLPPRVSDTRWREALEAATRAWMEEQEIQRVASAPLAPTRIRVL